MGVTGHDRDDVKVKGVETGGDVKEITSIADNGVNRLAVDAKVSLTGAPPEKRGYAKVHLLNAGSNDMTVDGSSTAVTFSKGPPNGEIWYVDQLVWKMLDAGNNDHDKFGAETALTNGVDIKFKVDGITYTYKGGIDDNGEILTTFTTTEFIGSSTGFLRTANFYLGMEEFKDEMTLVGADGDEFQVVINDDLTGLDRMEVEMRYWKDIS